MDVLGRDAFIHFALGDKTLVLLPLHHIRCHPERRMGCRSKAEEWVSFSAGILPSTCQDGAGSQAEKCGEKMERREVCAVL